MYAIKNNDNHEICHHDFNAKIDYVNQVSHDSYFVEFAPDTTPTYLSFCLFHAATLSLLDVLQSVYSNFVSFFVTNLLTYCQVPVAVFPFFASQNIPIKRSPNAAKLLGDFFGPKDNLGAKKAPGGGPWGPQDTRAHERPLPRPDGWWAHEGHLYHLSAL